MNHKLQSLTTDELNNLLNQERKKFIVALDYGATPSDLEEIREQIKQLETLIDSRKPTEQPRRSETRSQSMA